MSHVTIISLSVPLASEAFKCGATPVVLQLTLSNTQQTLCSLGSARQYRAARKSAEVLLSEDWELYEVGERGEMAEN